MKNPHAFGVHGGKPVGLPSGYRGGSMPAGGLVASPCPSPVELIPIQMSQGIQMMIGCGRWCRTMKVGRQHKVGRHVDEQEHIQ